MGNKVVHSVDIPAGSTPVTTDRVTVGSQMDVPNLAGGSAGAAVTTAVVMAGLPAKYAVSITPDQDAVFYVTAKTQDGFNVVLNPRLAANTLAAGTFDVTVTA